MDCRVPARFVMALALWAAASPPNRAEVGPADYAVQLTATVEAAPPRITLRWPAAADASTIKISRKAPEGTSWTQLRALVGTAASYTDATVTPGVAYEYRAIKYTTNGYYGTGYALSGIDVPMADFRGQLILIVDKVLAVDLAPELAVLEQDLIGDGWEVIRRDVARTESPAVIRRSIQSDYAANPQKVKAVFLFGHVPVPYSGAFAPDGHSDHFGAWPADAFYGEMTSNWTDTTVDTTTADRAANWNVPGDGKFDQTEFPSKVELAVGRVDLSDLKSFAMKAKPIGEIELHRAYLNRNHRFRVGLLTKPRTAFICDNFGRFGDEAFAASGWRSFAPMVGANRITSVEPFSFVETVGSVPYMWGFAAGPGYYLGATGLGTSTDLATIDIRTTFLMLFGSYFGDWDNSANFMRTALGSGHCLAVMWAGRPHWFMHHMALGETLGYSTLKTQNNRFGGIYARENPGTYLAHIALLGDPTLRLHAVLPPTNVVAAATAGGTLIGWTASPDPAVLGYVVYRATSVQGPFQRLTGPNTILSELSFDDEEGDAQHAYMVRAVKKETSSSGTYLNPSVGVIAAPTATGAEAIPNTPGTVRTLTLSSNRLSIAWTDRSNNEDFFEIHRRVIGSSSGVRFYSVSANQTTFANSGLTPSRVYGYQIRAGNAAGVSPWSNEVLVTLPSADEDDGSATVEFLGKDRLTLGNWEGTYGASGYLMAGIGAIDPPIGEIERDASPYFLWADPTTNPAGLRRPGSTSRVAACWYSGGTLEVRLSFEDDFPHQVALYCMDFDEGGRQQNVEVIDRATGAVLDSRVLAGFDHGAYLVWNIKGDVTLRVQRLSGHNCVVSGVFID